MRGAWVALALVACVWTHVHAVETSVNVWGHLEDRGRSPEPIRAWHSTSYIGGHLYVVAGLESVADVSSVYSFDLEKKEWALGLTIGTGPSARSSHAAAVLGESKVVLYGGKNRVRAFGDVYVLETKANSMLAMRWLKPRTYGRKPTPRWGHSLSVIGKVAWVIGGGEGAEFTADVYQLNTASWKWKRTAATGDAPEALAAHSACVHGQDIVVFGGGTGHMFTNDVYVLHTAEGAWERPAVSGPLPGARESHAAVVMDDVMLVYGGWASGQRSAYGDVWRLDLRTWAWSRVAGAGTSGSVGHTMTAVGSMVFVVGGQRMVRRGYTSAEDLGSLVRVLDASALTAPLPTMSKAQKKEQQAAKQRALDKAKAQEEEEEAQEEARVQGGDSEGVEDVVAALRGAGADALAERVAGAWAAQTKALDTALDAVEARMEERMRKVLGAFDGELRRELDAMHERMDAMETLLLRLNETVNELTADFDMDLGAVNWDELLGNMFGGGGGLGAGDTDAADEQQQDAGGDEGDPEVFVQQFDLTSLLNNGGALDELAEMLAGWDDLDRTDAEREDAAELDADAEDARLARNVAAQMAAMREKLAALDSDEADEQ